MSEDARKVGSIHSDAKGKKEEKERERKKRDFSFTSSKFAGGLEDGEGEQIGGHTQEGTILVGLLRDGGEVMNLTIGVGVLHKDSKDGICCQLRSSSHKI